MKKVFFWAVISFFSLTLSNLSAAGCGEECLFDSDCKDSSCSSCYSGMYPDPAICQKKQKN